MKNIESADLKGFENVEMRQEIYECSNMKEVFDLVLEGYYKNDIAIRYIQDDQVISVDGYSLLTAIRKCASSLLHMGYHRAHMAIAASNTYEYLLLYSAIVYSGNIAVLISKDSSTDQIKAECELADVQAFFYDHTSEEKAMTVCRELNISSYNLINSIADFCQSDLSDIWPVINNTKREDLITLFFTSGTTGQSKAVAMSNRSIFSMMISPTYPLRSQLIVLPLHHVAALSMYISTFGILAETHLCSGLESFIRDLKTLRSESLLAVPMLLKIMHIRLRNAGWDQNKLGWNVKMIGCGGAAFPAEVMDEFARSGIRMVQFYGMTETGGGGIFSLMTPQNRFSIGNQIMYRHEADIVDGELVLKSCRQMLGYYKNPEETEKVMRDGWVYTGDLARRDQDGYFYLIGRKKNLIILANGENISPEEIETRINMSEDVSESMVYGDKKFLHISIYPSIPEDASEQTVIGIKARIQEHVDRYNDEVPTYKMLRFVEFRDIPFERNHVGKIVRDYVNE